MNISFRPALKDDLPQILNIEEESFEEPWSKEIFKMMLERSSFKQSDTNSHNFYICVEDDKIIGYIIWEKEYFYEKSKNLLHPVSHIINFCVKFGERRKGYGREMLEFGLKKMIEDQLNYCYLEVRESNYAARSLYESFGMKHESNLHNYYLDEDGLIYTKELR